ncbi:MAG: ATP-dependent 6-phosphofructokinase [Candidatus Omnitrophota bacterium]
MESGFPELEGLKDLAIEQLGTPCYESPFKGKDFRFVSDDSGVLVYSNTKDIERCKAGCIQPPAFQEAGPRKKIYFNSKDVVAGMLTAGGLCPGLNDVIRTIVMQLTYEYGVKKIYGFRYGYEGISSKRHDDPMILNPQVVGDIQHQGGTILGTSRGDQDLDDMLETLQKFEVNVLFVIGGDGTFRGAHKLANLARERNLDIAFIGVPKTIDNDIFCSEKTFGFSTAVEEARSAIYGAHEEAEAAWNGIGLVKLMGRDSGFIAMHATLANSDVNFCLIPEVQFTLEGENGLLARLEKRLERRRHAVVVAAEGAGQNLIKDGEETMQDSSGNILHKDIGLYLKHQILRHFKEKGIPVTLKYIDPSYMIRSCEANAEDSSFCLLLGQNAVHAAMAGKTNMFVAYWNNHFTHVPLKTAVGRRKTVNPLGDYWQSVIAMTD